MLRRPSTNAPADVPADAFMECALDEGPWTPCQSPLEMGDLADGRHVLMQLRDGDRVHKGLAFGMANRVEELTMGVPLHMVHTPRWNEEMVILKLAEPKVEDEVAGARSQRQRSTQKLEAVSH